MHSSDKKNCPATQRTSMSSYVFTEHRIEVNVSTDDADTMVASKAMNLSLNEDFEIKAEDNLSPYSSF